MKLIFATHNPHKIKELQEIFPSEYVLQSLDEAGVTEDIPETGQTLEQNALLKARYVFKKTGCVCFADDTGLEVEALNNEPGVYSARYAGKEATAEDNTRKLLIALEGVSNRNARFRTVIAYIDEKGEEHLFEGRAEGCITTEMNGNQGFGYDPLFLPTGNTKTFAEMKLEEKNKISHRGRAIAEFLAFLRSRS